MRTTKKQREHFRVAIFGSARTDKGNESYRRVFELAKLLGKEHIDIVTGGGPGTMAAASAGHKIGDKRAISKTYGLLIKLPKEQRANRHLDIRKEFTKFSERLHNFMILSDVAVVSPGGVGTILEFFYTLQLVQTRKVKQMPIIMIGNQWEPLIKWMRNYPMKRGFMSKTDLNSIFYVKSVQQAFNLILRTKKLKEKGVKNIFKKLRR